MQHASPNHADIFHAQIYIKKLMLLFFESIILSSLRQAKHMTFPEVEKRSTSDKHTTHSQQCISIAAFSYVRQILPLTTKMSMTTINILYTE
jgi:hypothetical protein